MGRRPAPVSAARRATLHLSWALTLLPGMEDAFSSAALGQKSTRRRESRVCSETLNKSGCFLLRHNNFYSVCNASEQSYKFVKYIVHLFSLLVFFKMDSSGFFSVTKK